MLPPSVRPHPCLPAPVLGHPCTASASHQPRGASPANLATRPGQASAHSTFPGGACVPAVTHSRPLSFGWGRSCPLPVPWWVGALRSVSCEAPTLSVDKHASPQVSHHACETQQGGRPRGHCWGPWWTPPRQPAVEKEGWLSPDRTEPGQADHSCDTHTRPCGHSGACTHSRAPSPGPPPTSPATSHLPCRDHGRQNAEAWV